LTGHARDFTTAVLSAEQSSIVERTREHARQAFAHDSSGHDYWHTHRVWQLAARIGAAEGADQYLVQLAALLHDVGDWKLSGVDYGEADHPARAWLDTVGACGATVDAVVEIATHLSFKGAGVPTPMATLEGRVVQDADRLDAIGAIGVARAFAYGGWKGYPLHSPDVEPVLHGSVEAYRGGVGGTINHFYEKLLLLRDRLNTPTGRQIAEGRHRYLEGFLVEFLREWNGEA
jgi:uncharacterized protein